MAFFNQERGWERVGQLLTDAQAGKITLHISIINFAEVQYTVLRRRKDSTRILAALESLPIIKASADAYIPSVVTLKAYHPVALADCFAVALALELGCPVVTGDPEFRKVESLIDVEWL